MPAYAWFWTEARHWRLRPVLRAALIATACVAGIASFLGRVAAYDDNAFARVQAYAATQIPPGAVVVADEAIGDLFSQPYCREQEACPAPASRGTHEQLNGAHW